MTTEPSNQTCPKCGAEIPPEAPQGLCPKCVMSGVATEAGVAPPEINAEDAPDLQRVSAAFPNLEILELVGRGGMGFVFKARQPHLGRFVALKLLPDKLAADPNFAERFNREGRVLARLNHPHIVSVYDFGQTNGFYYLMMEFVDGVNLRQAMRAGRFSPAEALAVVPTICEALQYAHDQGVLHRDIKPENILLDAKGYVKIADFGIAKLVGEDAAANVTLTMTGSSLGTPHYMAPEQLEKPSEVDHRADIYSLGVVLYEMLTGELPIGRFDAPSSRTPVGKGVDDVVFRALEKNREKRQGSADEFKTQVQTAGTEEVPPKIAPNKRSESKVCDVAAVGTMLVGLSLVNIVVGLFIRFLMNVPVSSATFFFPVVVPFLAMSIMGTVLGWVGLVQIKRSGGRLYGTAISLFSALTYPIGLPALVIIAFPMILVFPAGANPGLIARVTIFAIIAGSLSALIWSAVAICRWAYNRPRGEHWSTRSWAIWTAAIFVVMLLIALGNLGGARTSGVNSNRVSGPILNQISAEDRLPDGSVELLAISRHPSDGIWWKPDGTAWTDPPFENPGHTAMPNKDQQAFEMVFRLPEEYDRGGGVEMIVAGSTGSSGGSAPIQNGERVEHGYFLAALFPKETVSATITVGVPMGDWETLATTGGVAPASTSLTYKGKPAHLKLLNVARDENGDAIVVVTHDLEEKRLRLVAVDEDGVEVRPVQLSRSGGDMTFRFEQTTPGEIQQFRFQVRNYRWAVLEDVWLSPRENGVRNGELSQRGVRMNFHGVQLVDRNGEERLEVTYSTKENSAFLTWGTSGAFDDGPVDLSSSASVTEQESGSAVIIHKASLQMPPSLDREVVIKALKATREKWNGQSLVVLPGDQHTILTIEHAPGHAVSLTVGSKVKDP